MLTKMTKRENDDEAPSRSRRSTCPVAGTLDLVGDRWSLLVMRDLLTGSKRYGELLASEEHIPTNILAARLKHLERVGLIERVPYSAHPPRYTYRLTAQGRALGPAIDALATWSLAHLAGTVRTIPSLDELTRAGH
jgi:DNA-binding HxlR family transcriptional regulator